MKVQADAEEQAKLLNNFLGAQRECIKCLGGKPGMVAEKRYGIAYQQLVKAGLKPQLKGKYRG